MEECYNVRHTKSNHTISVIMDQHYMQMKHLRAMIDKKKAARVIIKNVCRAKVNSEKISIQNDHFDDIRRICKKKTFSLHAIFECHSLLPPELTESYVAIGWFWSLSHDDLS